MQTDGSHHKQPHLSAAHQGTGRQQSCKGLSQPHLIGQNGAATGQEPTDTGALMAQRATTILQGFVEICCRNKGPVRGQRGQGVLAPIKPLLQSRGDRETAPEGLLKCIGCGQGEIPAMAGADPTPPRLNPTQLGLGHCIKRADHADQSCWREIQATGQCGI
jgi:hypothetical protein